MKLSKAITMCRKVANRLGRYESEKQMIFEFLKNRPHWHEHIKDFGIKASCKDLRFMYKFGGVGSEKERIEVTNYIIKNCV